MKLSDIKRIENIPLSQYTTFKIGGKCKELYFPQNKEELVFLLNNYPQARILGGGSNLLVNDAKEFGVVICLRECGCNDISISGNEVMVGCGVRLQKLISFLNIHGLGGIEYLYSVPGLVGGAIVMNAGRGRNENQQISDYLCSVDVWENGRIEHYSKDKCGFSYRNSIFQKRPCVILSATFHFDYISPEKGRALQRERIDLCKKYQDNQYPNAGTSFCQADTHIMNLMKKISSSNKKTGIHFSKKTTNWIQNRGEGTFKEAMHLIQRVELMHRLLGKPVKLEYKIWF